MEKYNKLESLLCQVKHNIETTLHVNDNKFINQENELVRKTDWRTNS